eukprot:TRINITY_DN12945_c1_g1_i1.p1 TRINITY_DN12945_c1_g1~~TRINITY_DN12945_c1_g1_i1.p1  ORF type:complete len:401 (+),score=135.18 TRINITY_DN12945_c1_g1_i1:90-1205(+)
MGRGALCLAVAGALHAALAAPDLCPAGVPVVKGNKDQDCCSCEAGFAQPGCTTCKQGYYFYLDAATNRTSCFNGITDCRDELPPPYGCGSKGTCVKQGNYFSCECTGGYTGRMCETPPPQGGGAGGAPAATCRPEGVHMYTQFPQEVVTGRDFDLVIWGCKLSSFPLTYRIVPLGGACNASIPAACQRQAASGSVGADCTSIQVDGAVVSTTAPFEGKATIPKLQLPAAAAPQGSGMYKLCAKGPDPARWSEAPIQTHDDRGYRSDGFLVVSPSEADLRGAAGLGGEAKEWDCCDKDEIRVGDACIPLWLWIVLMLLLLLALALLAFQTHKVHSEIEAERNNRQFQAFGGQEDSSMLKMAAKRRDGADDDV